MLYSYHKPDNSPLIHRSMLNHTQPVLQRQELLRSTIPLNSCIRPHVQKGHHFFVAPCSSIEYLWSTSVRQTPFLTCSNPDNVGRTHLASRVVSRILIRINPGSTPNANAPIRIRPGSNPDYAVRVKGVCVVQHWRVKRCGFSCHCL